MLRRRALPLVLLTMSLGIASSSSAAADRDTSDYWIEKLVTYYAESAPYTLVYGMEMQIEQQGTKVGITASGDILYAGAEQVRANIDMKMAMELLPEPMKMSMKMVHDGEFIWTEMENPMAGGTQVMKMSAEAAREMQANSGLGSGINSDQLDPASQAKMLSEMMELEVASIADGIVRLEGALTDEVKAQLGDGAQLLSGEEDLGRVVLILDEKTGAMRRMTMGDPVKPFITMNYEDMKLIPKGDLPADAFTYVPPEGVTVRDLTQVLKDGQGGGASADEPEAAPVR